MERSNLLVELNTDCNASGSCTWAFGDAHVIASVYGPKEANMANELTHRACIDVSISPVSGFHTPCESEMELYITQLLERLIEVKKYPRNQFNVRIQIVSGISGHAVTMAACINAVSLALLQTAIPLTASIVAVCSSEVDANCRPVALSIDMANPSISEPTRAKRTRSDGDHESTQAIFSVYSGRLDSPVSNDKVFLSSQLLSMVTNLDPQGLLCSRARDLYEAMTAQLTANLF
ncbi:unnamed protein product [Hymenolepis diminuta]|uniref:RNase_PH domain-containing protein n=1 Tax=Hymenolepis diminuta TaxID=6216 RepID=A0A0R3SBX4_HYMDI|nr:unnamed protein product [Hymenolepis diminuta]VUZ46549.1 unnamed protein product [Hymenolepis diminuta]